MYYMSKTREVYMDTTERTCKEEIRTGWSAIWFLICTLFTGCSIEPLKDQPAATPAPAVQVQAEAPKSEDPTAYHSLTVADQFDLPKCNDIAEGWIVYVKNDAEFQVCAGGGWLTVDIKGKQGDHGTDGVKGEKGEQGVAGKDGVGIPKGTETYFDPEDGQRGWRIASPSATYTQAATLCPNGYALAEGVPGIMPPVGFFFYFMSYLSTYSSSVKFWVSSSTGPGFHNVAKFTASTYSYTLDADNGPTHIAVCYEVNP
jgi:hypothetical protein